MSFVFIPNAGDERSLRVPTPAGRNLPRRPDRPLKNERTCHSEGRVCPRNLLFLCLFAKGESKNGSGGTAAATLKGPEGLTLRFQQAEGQSDPRQAIRKKKKGESHHLQLALQIPYQIGGILQEIFLSCD